MGADRLSGVGSGAAAVFPVPLVCRRNIEKIASIIPFPFPEDCQFLLSALVSKRKKSNSSKLSSKHSIKMMAAVIIIRSLQHALQIERSFLAFDSLHPPFCLFAFSSENIDGLFHRIESFELEAVD